MTKPTRILLQHTYTGVRNFTTYKAVPRGGVWANLPSVDGFEDSLAC